MIPGRKRTYGGIYPPQEPVASTPRKKEESYRETGEARRCGGGCVRCWKGSNASRPAKSSDVESGCGVSPLEELCQLDDTMGIIYCLSASLGQQAVGSPFLISGRLLWLICLRGCTQQRRGAGGAGDNASWYDETTLSR